MKKGLVVALALMLVLSLTVVAFGNQPDFNAYITITSATGEFTVVEGGTLNLTADWETNRDVTRESWSVDEVVKQGPTEIVGATSGTSYFTFSAVGLTAGQTYDVSFRIWHHQQTDRDATETQEVEVVTAAIYVDYPAAPTVANRLIREHMPELKRSDVNWLIREVAHEMGDEYGKGTDFHEIAKTDVAAYEAAVKAFMMDLVNHP